MSMIQILQYIHLHTYIYIHSGCIIYHVSNRTYILQVRVINVFQTNQKQTKTENLNKCEISLNIVSFASFQNCAPKWLIFKISHHLFPY